MKRIAYKPKTKKDLKTMVKKEIKHTLSANVETKQWFAGIVSTPFEGGPGAGPISIDMLTPIVQGTTRLTRVGNEITLKHVKLRYSCRQVSGINAFSHCRVLVCQVKENPATISIAKLLELDPAGAQSAYSMRSIDFMHTYNVLYDKVHKMVGPSALQLGYTESSVIFHTANIPLKYAQKKIQYAPAPSGVQNGLYLFVISDVVGPVGPGSPVITLDYAVSFTDS